MVIINFYRPIEITNIFLASIRFQTGQWKYIWKKKMLSAQIYSTDKTETQAIVWAA